MTETWEAQLRRAFPEWSTEAARARWPSDRQRLRLGQEVRGTVVASAPFGVWVDIGLGHPTLLLVPNMGGGRSRPMRTEDYPHVGDTLLAHVERLGDNAEIGLTQRPARPPGVRDGAVEPETAPGPASPPGVEAELWLAARSPSPVGELVGAVLLWRSAGVTQAEAEARLTTFRAAVVERAPELEDAVLDTLDFIVGWCSPHMRLFP